MRIMLALFVAALIVPAAAQKPASLALADYAEIQQVYARYSHGIDASDSKLLSTVFTADGEFVMGTNVRKWSDLAQGPAKERALARHVTTSIVIDPTPDGARGTAFIMLVNLQATPPAFTGGGVYEDVLVKTAAGWRFKKRTYFQQSAAPAPAKPSSR